MRSPFIYFKYEIKDVVDYTDKRIKTTKQVAK